MSTARELVKSFDRPVNLTQHRLTATKLRSFRNCVADLPGITQASLFFTAAIILLLLIPAITYQSAKLLGEIGDNLSQTNAISVFIEEQASINLHDFTDRLATYTQIETVNLLSEPIDSGGVDNKIIRLVEVIPETDLAGEDFNQLTELLGALAGVQLVSWDSATASRNQKASKSVKLVAMAAHTIALVLFSSIMWVSVRRHFRASKMTINLRISLGATNAQVSAPLIVRGCIYGLLIGAVTYFIAMVNSLFLSRVIDVTLFEIDLAPHPQEILFYAVAVMLLSFTISRLAAKNEICF